MEKLSMNYHLKLQEMCDCYMETDFQALMQNMSGAGAGDLDENAVKYLALAIMYAITKKAEKLSFKKKGEEIDVKVKNDDKEELPPPPGVVLERVFAIMRTILHIEEDKGEMDFSLGLRSGEVNVRVKVAKEGDKQSLKIKFPAQ